MKRLFVVMTISAMALGYGPAQANEAVVTKAGCMACHAKDKKVIGPAFKDIALKYKGDAAAQEKLVEKVRKGSSGVWGPIPMPPNAADKISDDDLKAAVDWILKGAA